MREPLFLTLAEVIQVHTDQIRRYGGQGSVRDLGLLESALAQPEASFGGEWLHRDAYEMAAGKIEKTQFAQLLRELSGED